MCADEAGDDHVPAAGYELQYPQSVQPFHQHQNWNRQNYYEGKALGNNGQGDGDGPPNFGRGGEGGAPEDAAVLVEEQDGVTALLVAVDARREKQLASERVLQK